MTQSLQDQIDEIQAAIRKHEASFKSKWEAGEAFDEELWEFGKSLIDTE